jgi:hypothetical protein
MVPPEKPSENTTWLPWLIGAMVVLALILAWDWLSSSAPTEDTFAAPVAREQRPVSRALQAQSTDVSRNPLAHLKLGSLHDTLERPLFEKLRRPVEPPRKTEMPAVAPIKTTVHQNTLTLVGVLKSKTMTVALLKRKDTGQSVRAEEGDIIDGWSVKQIEFQRVILVQGDQEVSLQLLRKPNR